ncbi:hypothetical protein H6P81_015715 [Aristolochia fimbriata]|uniref:Uncharacterized protein n=1 Tax=Aristolochia fimbriata TaxID=158543 RepID=A0AAV7E6B4_ARIFI|nr:hypothetical protein H6P81_015715 [Aristolochia fimbriata]
MIGLRTLLSLEISSFNEEKSSEPPTFSAAEAQLVKGSLDFVGVDHCTTYYARNNSTNAIDVLPNVALADSEANGKAISEKGMNDPNSPFISIKDALEDEKRIKFHTGFLQIYWLLSASASTNTPRIHGGVSASARGCICICKGLYQRLYGGEQTYTVGCIGINMGVNKNKHIQGCVSACTWRCIGRYTLCPAWGLSQPDSS